MSVVSERPLLLRTLDRIKDDPTLRRQIYERIRPYGEFEAKHLVFWVERFREGVQYEYDKYGFIADRFAVVKTIETPQASYDDTLVYGRLKDGRDHIAVKYKFLAMGCRCIRKGSYSTTPHVPGFLIRHNDLAFLHGIEEAHHAYIHRSGQGVFYHTAGDYVNDPVELAAGVEIRAVIKEKQIPLRKVA